MQYYTNEAAITINTVININININTLHCSMKNREDPVIGIGLSENTGADLPAWFWESARKAITALRPWDTSQGNTAGSRTGASVPGKLKHLFCNSWFVFFACFLSQRKICLSNWWNYWSFINWFFSRGEEEKLIGWDSTQYTIILCEREPQLSFFLSSFQATTFNSLSTTRIYLLNQKIFISHAIAEYGKC